MDEFRNCVVYGKGDASRAVIKNTREEKILAVVDMEADGSRELNGLAIINDEYLKKCGVDFDLIIASQYYDIIIDRLRKQGKLDNQHMKSILTPNLYKDTPPYDDKATPHSLNEDEWRWIIEKFTDNYSQKIISLVRNNRCIDSAPDYLDAVKCVEYAGKEDYFSVIRGGQTKGAAIVLDCGAYDGDSVDFIADHIDEPIIKYYAFEPMAETYKILKNKKNSKIQELIAINKAVGGAVGTVTFAFDEERPDASSVDTSGAKGMMVDMLSIDSLELNYDADYFVKMDIEGSELDALKGGEKLIKTYRPNLGICLYHKTRDIYEIPRYIDSLDLGYKFYLSGGSHTIMNAVSRG